MVRVLACIVDQHNTWLTALSAAICVLGCYTTTMLMARASAMAVGARRTLALAAAVFGGSVWSLHFVALLAFLPARHLAYAAISTAGSALVAVLGAGAALLVWRGPLPRVYRVLSSGVLFGLAVTGMHYIGVDALAASSFLSFDHAYVAASVAVSITLFVAAVLRADHLRRVSARLEVAGWMTLAICSLHFTGMAAVTMVPLANGLEAGVVGSNGLAVVVGGVTVCILVVGLAAVTVEQHLSRRSVQELDRMRLMSNLAREVLLIHRDGMVLEMNQAGERMFKAPVNEVVGRQVLSLFAQNSVPALIRRSQCDPTARHPEEMEFQAVDGTQVPVELSCQPIDYLGKPATVVALRDLTDRKRDEARILHMARHDMLTGLSNRHALMERLNDSLEAAAQRQTALALLFIDLDSFKPVNDVHGHAAGDAILVQAAKRLRAELQPADILARIGGDEFVVVLTGGPHPEKASVVSTRVVEAFRRPFQVEDVSVKVGASIGIALYPEDGATADTLMRAADTAMYRVKEEGCGAARFFEATMNAELHSRRQLEQELDGAADRGELRLLFQPIVNGRTGTLENFEALIRWENPRRGLVSPAEFIPLAEQTGLIDQIGRWVVDTACKEAASWPEPWRVSVNVSPRQFHRSNVCDVVDAALRRHGLDPDRLVVEVTEGVLIDDATKAVATLRQLRSMGVRIALDDFGTGYSSLNYLQMFRFDKFKIDQSFVARLGHSDDAMTLTRTIVNLGHNLGLSVTAEGVERPDQLAILRQLGCDYIQGYLIGRPASVAAFGGTERERVAELFGEEWLRLSA